MNGLYGSLAMLCTAGGLVAGLAVLSRTGAPLVALKVALELWTAAGLMRLAGAPSWQSIAGAATIVLLRQLLSRDLRASAATLAGSAVTGPAPTGSAPSGPSRGARAVDALLTPVWLPRRDGESGTRR